MVNHPSFAKSLLQYNNGIAPSDTVFLYKKFLTALLLQFLIMRFYMIKIILLFCIVQNSLADWRDDVKNAHIKKLYAFIAKEQKVILSSAVIHNTAGGWTCVNTATTQLTNLMFPHRGKVIQCVDSASNPNDANKCCDPVDNSAMLQAAAITNNALSCIMGS